MNTVQMHKETLETWMRVVSRCHATNDHMILAKCEVASVLEAHREIFHANKIIKALIEEYPDAINKVMVMSGKLYRRDDE